MLFKNALRVAGKMALLLQPLADLPEDLGLIPSTHLAIITIVLGDPVPS